MKELALPPDTVRLYHGFGGEPVWRQTFTVLLGVHDMQPVLVEVAADPEESIVLLGRDVLNQHRIVLDGPNQRLEIG